MTAIRSLPIGVVFGAIAIVASAMLAVWLSGYLPVFTANRGLLQFVVAIPLAALVTAATLAYSGLLTSSQLLWAMVPVAVIILLGVGVLGPGYAAWPWMLGISAVVFIPWVAGLLIGSAMGQS